ANHSACWPYSRPGWCRKRRERRSRNTKSSSSGRKCSWFDCDNPHCPYNHYPLPTPYLSASIPALRLSPIFHTTFFLPPSRRVPVGRPIHSSSPYVRLELPHAVPRLVA